MYTQRHVHINFFLKKKRFLKKKLGSPGDQIQVSSTRVLVCVWGRGSYLRTYVYAGSQVILLILCFVFHELIALNAYQFTVLCSLMVLIACWDFGAQ